MKTVEIAGIRIGQFFDDAGWIPEIKLVPTPTTLANLRKILPALSAGHNLLLVGDAGIGKNALIYYINSIRKHPTIRYSFNEDTLPEDLVGAYRLDPSGKGFIWSDGPLTMAMRHGYVFVADEMNLALPEVLKRFLSVFQENKLQLLEGDSSIIDAAPGFAFVGTQNPAEGFEGRKTLPREIQKHLVTLYLDPYPPSELAEILRGLFPKTEKKLIGAAVEIARRVEDGLITRKVGTKDLERYHFNLRNLNRLFIRMSLQRADFVREVEDILVKPFRTNDDRTFVQSILAEVLTAEGISIPPGNSIQSHANTKDGLLDIGRSRLTLSKDDIETRVRSSFRKYAAAAVRKESFEAIARSIEAGEHVLLESEPDVEPEEFAKFITSVRGRNLAIVALAKGMHTSDVIGALKPSDKSGVEWVDGPLTKAIRRGDDILIQGLEAAGAELVEKLNMLLDDAKSLSLPPESGERDPVRLKDEARIFAVKYFRKQKSTPTISRAFRNRFSGFVIDPINDAEDLIHILEEYLNFEQGEASELVRVIESFHRLLRDRAQKREIGSANLQPYEFGLTNLRRLCESIGFALAEPENLSPEQLQETIVNGADLAYLNEISNPTEREKMRQLLLNLLKGVPFENLIEELRDWSKKKALETKSNKGKIWWDQDEHWREANTGRAPYRLDGQELKEGININTPETGGNVKEGPEAWYGSDTEGNKGRGQPGQGGGGYGYRTEELYQEFLKKRKPLWEYNIGASLEDFLETFGPEIERITIDFDKLLDPEVDINRRYMSLGSRVDVRRYLGYLSGKSDSRVFDRTVVSVEDDKLKGVEVLFAINKGRRIFNFDYSVAVLVALMSAGEIFSNHNIPFGVMGYSDLKNDKKTVDLQWFKHIPESYEMQLREGMFHGISANWHGDTIAEYQIIEELYQSFSPDAKTKILVFLSDFRGIRAKITAEKDLASFETQKLKEAVKNFTNRGLVTLGVGLGIRSIAPHVFQEHIDIAGENYMNLPNLLSARVSEIIHRYHNAV